MMQEKTLLRRIPAESCRIEMEHEGEKEMKRIRDAPEETPADESINNEEFIPSFVPGKDESAEEFFSDIDELFFKMEKRKEKTEFIPEEKGAYLSFRAETELETESAEEAAVQELCAEKKPGTAEEMFLKRGFRLDICQGSPMPEGVKKLACRMAEEYGQLRDFCRMLRACNSGTGRKFSYIAPAGNTECVRQFAEDMRKYGVLVFPDQIAPSAGCRDRMISGHIPDTAAIVTFFNGLWLEKFAFIEAEKAAKESAEKLGTDYEVMANVMIEEENTGRKNELDVVIRVGRSLFWIECKCGTLHESVYRKYYELGRRISVVPDHMIFLAAELDDAEKSEIISYFYQYRVCGLNDYRRSLREMLERAET